MDPILTPAQQRRYALLGCLVLIGGAVTGLVILGLAIRVVIVAAGL